MNRIERASLDEVLEQMGEVEHEPDCPATADGTCLCIAAAVKRWADVLQEFMGLADKGQLRVVKGYVWCDKRGEIHDDCLDPYNYGAPKPEWDDERCLLSDHTRVYARQ